MLPLLGLLVAVASSPQAAPESGSARAHPRNLLVRVAPELARVPSRELFPDVELRELWNLPQISWRAIEVGAGKREEARARLAESEAVRAVEHDRARELVQASAPNDVLFASQWYLSQIRAPEAWETEAGEPSVVVALIDTGVDLLHPDLAANLWTNPGEVPGNGLDDDSNGYADDVCGWDFANLDGDPSDDHGHGTACAGIVAAVQGNALGISGVAPGCRLAVIKAAPSSGRFYASALVPALVYCADMGFPVLSMSFYSDEVVAAERDAIAYCLAQGSLPVVAAGNQNSVLPTYPAAYPQALAVGATSDSLDARAFFTNFGSWVAAAAPGWSLATTSPFGGWNPGFSGTSGAAPQVAGIAALLFSAAPAATPAAVRAAIEDSCAPLYEPPYGRWAAYGRVDAEAALQRVLGATSGSVPARVAFAAPCGGKGLGRTNTSPGIGVKRDAVVLELTGVGFEPPNTIVVWNGAHSLGLLSQQRNVVRAVWPTPSATNVQLRRNGALVQSWVWEDGPGLLYAATDACTEDTLGSQASGGWAQLVRVDGSAFTCTADATGAITCEFAVRKVAVRDIGRLTLELAREYQSMGAAPVETVELYDWSTASHPYGDWVQLSSAPAPTAGPATLHVDPPGDPNRFRDAEGTFYLRITTSGAGASGVFCADMLRLRVR